MRTLAAEAARAPRSAGSRPRDGQARALVLATLAFTACFYAWSLLGPLSPDLQAAMGLSDVQTAVMVAVPVIALAFFHTLGFGLLALTAAAALLVLRQVAR
ncbi:MAG TPA: hypothetical protein VFG79_12110 [Solirubrobacter sp.]|nr:hypothetical protein [Solirubrobacter sp.]